MVRLLSVLVCGVLASCATPRGAVTNGAGPEAAPWIPAMEPPQAPVVPDLIQPAILPAGAAWSMSGSPVVTRLVSGAELVEFDVTKEGRRIGMQVVLFDQTRCDLRVVDQSGGDWAGAGAIRGAMRSVNAVAGVNGGFFTPEFEAMGLVIADGAGSGTFQNSGLVSGAVATGAGGPLLLWNSEYRSASEFSQFLQAGPRLVNRGEVVSGLSRGKTATRTFVATDGGSRWVVGLAKSPSLAELAEILVSPGLLPDLRVWRALNLDGGRSSSLWVRRENGAELSWTGWSTVRNFLAIVPR